MRVNDIQFHYEILGEAKNHPPVILIAGYCCDIHFWRPVAETLSKDRQVLIFDNQGIGQTKDDGHPLSIASMTLNIKAFLDALVKAKQLAKGPFVIAGFAMGGNIAQQFAADYPEDTHQLLLLNSVLKFSEQAKSYCEGFCKAREVGDLLQYAALIYDSAFGDAFKAENPKIQFVPAFAEAIKDLQTAADQRRQVEVLKASDATAFVSKIKVPTLIIQAQQDLFSTLSDGKALEHALRQNNIPVTVHPVPGGHASILESFEELMVGLKAFLNSVEHYSKERQAEFILSNALDAADYKKARQTVKNMGLDPDKIQHYPFI